MPAREPVMNIAVRQVNSIAKETTIAAGGCKRIRSSTSRQPTTPSSRNERSCADKNNSQITEHDPK